MPSGRPYAPPCDEDDDASVDRLPLAAALEMLLLLALAAAAVAVAGARAVRRLLRTPPLSDIVTGELTPGLATVPDPDGDGGSDADWETWIRATYISNDHPIATAAMMRRELGGVVDARLTVYDTANVRVVDASMMPMQVSAHLSSTLYGVAEKAADLIKAAQ